MGYMYLYGLYWADVFSAELSEETYQDALMHQKLLEDAYEGWEGRFVTELDPIQDDDEPLYLIVQEDELHIYRKTQNGMVPTHGIDSFGDGVQFTGLVGREPSEMDYVPWERVHPEHRSELEEYVDIIQEMEPESSPDLSAVKGEY